MSNINTIIVDYAALSNTAGTGLTSGALGNLVSYTNSNSFTSILNWPKLTHTSHNWGLTQDKLKEAMEDLNRELTKKEKKMNSTNYTNKTIDLFDDKDESRKLLEEYSIVEADGSLTAIGWGVLGKLLLAEKRETIVAKLKADKDSKKKSAK